MPKLAFASTIDSKSPIFDVFWQFAHRRQQRYLERLGIPTDEAIDDPILDRYRFTNVYRASDRVSQYLISNVIYDGSPPSEDLTLRILLFKIFNRVSTWEFIQREHGAVFAKSFDAEGISRMLSEYASSGQPIYSPAYIVPPIVRHLGPKHDGHLQLLRSAIDLGIHDSICAAGNLEELFNTLRGLQGIGPFLAYQFSIDLNYSTLVNFDEDDFVMPGPGALDGLSKMSRRFSRLTAPTLIKSLVDMQEEEFARRGLMFAGLFGRRLKLIDVQNLLCEVSKYTRVSNPDVLGISGRTRIKQHYRSAGLLSPPIFPPKWEVNVPPTPALKQPNEAQMLV